MDGELFHEQKNSLITLQVDKMRELLIGFVPESLILDYCALGTDDTAATSSDTSLGSEGARVYRTNLYGQGDLIIGEYTFTTTEAIGTWSEVGLFCSPTATDTADTGLLWSRAIIVPEIEKPSGKELTIRHVTTFTYS